MKVAIIHYWFISRRGGEKVVESMLKIYPNADIYTLFYDKFNYGNYLEKQKIYTSILNRSFLREHYQKIFPLYPIGIRSLKLETKYDLIISSESGPAKGIDINQKTPHVCYIHTPMRYCWSHKNEYLRSVSPIIRPLMNYFLKRLQKYDKSTVENVDLYISNSKNVAKRVRKYYNRESIVVYPPISEKLFNNSLEEKLNKDVYLSFGAITPYKRIDLLVETFNENGKKLIIIGEGSEVLKLQNKAAENIEFRGRCEWSDIEKVLLKTKALIFPGEEDFGIIPLEVMAYGIPVIAFKKGGALETVIEDKHNIQKSTGLFFDKQNKESILNSIEYFEQIEHNFNSKWIRNHAKLFSESNFKQNIKREINKFLKNKNS